MRFQFLAHEGPPRRILIENREEGLRYPITPAVFRARLPMLEIPGEAEIEAEALGLLLGEERQSLLLSAQRYLGAVERSPRALGRWMERRLIPRDWADALEARLREESFLSEERFAALWMKRHEDRGGKPLWILRRLLQALGVRRSVIEAVAFDEVEALRRFIKTRFSKVKEERLLTARLRRRGFSGSIIKCALSPESREPNA
jgi:SOS response regulatory protein OraA/RecX